MRRNLAGFLNALFHYVEIGNTAEGIISLRKTSHLLKCPDLLYLIFAREDERIVVVCTEHTVKSNVLCRMHDVDVAVDGLGALPLEDIKARCG